MAKHLKTAPEPAPEPTDPHAAKHGIVEKLSALAAEAAEAFGDYAHEIGVEFHKLECFVRNNIRH
jgi:hypothetical protein